MKTIRKEPSAGEIHLASLPIAAHGRRMSAHPGHLYIVPTPIGNLRDITLRARDTLAAVDLIACEDTRHSGTLLAHLEIRKPLVSLHQHNEAMRTAQFLTDLAGGKSIAYISDAGMPGVSDPGQRLVSACRQAGIPVEVLPGPSAVLTALIGSGFPADAFYFGGFLPVKSGQRERVLTAALDADETSIFFETPHRLETTLALLARIAPDRLICVARELTKKFEEYRRGPSAEVAAHYLADPAKGEICLLIAGAALPKWATAVAEKDGGGDGN